MQNSYLCSTTSEKANQAIVHFYVYNLISGSKVHDKSLWFLMKKMEKVGGVMLNLSNAPLTNLIFEWNFITWKCVVFHLTYSPLIHMLFSLLNYSPTFQPYVIIIIKMGWQVLVQVNQVYDSVIILAIFWYIIVNDEERKRIYLQIFEK